MNKTLNFYKRNIKETLRDPLNIFFCLFFPIIMIVLFQIINKYSYGNTPMFEISALLPAIIMFSYTFVMLTISILVSKDRQTSFLRRLFSSPMKSYQFILGYCSIGLIIGFFQTIICILSGFFVCLINNVNFLNFSQIILLIISQMPVLIINIFLGLVFGIIFNDKSAPGVCSIIISLSGILGGCWMPIETMGNFETFCRFLPFYPSVYIGRAVCNPNLYSFNDIAYLGFIPIFIFMIISIVLSLILFNKKMQNDA